MPTTWSSTGSLGGAAGTGAATTLAGAAAATTGGVATGDGAGAGAATGWLGTGAGTVAGVPAGANDGAALGARRPAYGTGVFVRASLGCCGAPRSTMRNLRWSTSRVAPLRPAMRSSQRCQAAGSAMRLAKPRAPGATRGLPGMGVRRSRVMAICEPKPAASRRAYSTGY